ncbi:MAG: hypothetical protein AAGK71_14950 [Pseudomonadota bacterium]
MGFESKYSVASRTDRSVGNIYDRLDAARRQREQVLETPEPANDDHVAREMSQQRTRPFPTLKPPRPVMEQETALRRWDWIVPWLLGVAIFALIFWFAVR